jgi:branched-subunit amino acid aminotransferase/4-amino-4-deoxychorismate lyase
VSEAFLASTLREVHPVARIEERELSAPGPLSRAAAAAVAERIRAAVGR